MACYRDSFTFCRSSDLAAVGARERAFEVISGGKERHGNMEKEEVN
jgi:hypothetical protein